ncbi:MAG: hypothetical protein JWR00_3825 [Rubritepida sp.]|nr:hypothetical protein [Rubritepida sp.]
MKFIPLVAGTVTVIIGDRAGKEVSERSTFIRGVERPELAHPYRHLISEATHITVRFPFLIVLLGRVLTEPTHWAFYGRLTLEHFKRRNQFAIFEWKRVQCLT